MPPRLVERGGEGRAPVAVSRAMGAAAGCCAGPGCDVVLVRAGTGRPRRFCSQACRQARYRADRLLELELVAAEFRNAALRTVGALLEDMFSEATKTATIRTWGGHLERHGSSVADACRRDQGIDERLVALLGGIPTGRRRGRVVALPSEPASVLEEAA